MKEIALPQFRVQAPEHWFDVTNEVEGEEPPSTLAADEGIGALQFSIADLPADVAQPTPTEVLRAMLAEFAKAHELGAPQNVAALREPRPLLSATFLWDGDFLKVWYLTEGTRLLFATYTCDQGETFAEELGEADQIIRSLAFV